MRPRKKLYLVLEAWQGDSQDFKEREQSVVRQLGPPLLQNRFFNILQNPEKTEQQISGCLLLQDNRTFGLK
jgi:hypothetical protein